jgi:hypothetical protein
MATTPIRPGPIPTTTIQPSEPLIPVSRTMIGAPYLVRADVP